MAEENKLVGCPRLGRSLALSSFCSPGPGPPAQLVEDGNPAGRLHFPTLFSFHIVHRFQE